MPPNVFIELLQGRRRMRFAMDDSKNLTVNLWGSPGIRSRLDNGGNTERIEGGGRGAKPRQRTDNGKNWEGQKPEDETPGGCQVLLSVPPMLEKIWGR